MFEVPVDALMLNPDNRRFRAERMWAEEQLGRQEGGQQTGDVSSEQHSAHEPASAVASNMLGPDVDSRGSGRPVLLVDCSDPCWIRLGSLPTMFGGRQSRDETRPGRVSRDQNHHLREPSASRRWGGVEQEEW